MWQKTLLLCVLLMAMFLSLTSNEQKPNAKSLKHILSKQGFTGLLRGKVKFTFLGDMKCGSKVLQVYYYTWEESEPHAAAIHFSQRLVFLEDRNYLGQYVISDPPVLEKPDLLRFPQSEDGGKSFKCGPEGLPKFVVLDGWSRVLFR